jgi:glycosyltransferase involved in cell wall biosynthesis
MIKILYIDTHYIYAGGQNHLIRLIDGLDKTKYFPMVLCAIENKKFIQELEQRNIKFFPIKTKNLITENKILKAILQTPNFLYLVFKTISIVKKEKIDILQANLFYSALFSLIAAKLCKKPFLWTLHTLDEVFKYKIFIKFLSEFSDSTITICNNYTEIAKKEGINVSKFQTIYDGIKAKEIISNIGELRINNQLIKKPIVAMIGRIDTEQKRQQDFIEAAEIVLKEIPEVYFLIVGGTSNPYEEKQKKELESLIKKKRISHRVLLTGFISNLEEILASIDIFVLPSVKEGVPAAILEAMVAKKPVIASNVGGIPEVVIDGETGFLVEPKNPKVIAEKIIFLLKNPEKAKEMGESGYQRIKNYFTLEKMAREHEKLYEELIKNQKLKSKD